MNIQKDVLIIGAGPIGIACALACKKKRLTYVVIEKGALTNSLYNYPLNMRFFSTSEKLEIDHIPFISNQPKPDRDEALEYYRRVATNNELTIRLYEKVISLEKKEAHFFATTKTQNSAGTLHTYSAKNIVVSTGFYDLPKQLNVPGESLPKVTHYYKEAHPYILQKVAVIGASNSAVDAALEIWRKGGDVTMIVRGDSIGDRVKYWVKPDIENRIEEGSIKAYFNTTVSEITENEITLTSSEKSFSIKNDFVIALTGYQPNFSFLESIGIELSNDGKKIPKYNPKTMESNVKGIYLAGVICGGMETHKWFIENSTIHADIIASDIAKKEN
ncbi:YpdA family putative bacillithiol disulfide reductase [Cochleicola gelatinilyticus]|uniref:Uncharacterized protein n=1 Tax=Cochleicola gelatinilyticus TaxID=1763537 RepID=A0A167F1P5_9FLAO|nr:YpdA family putative bacillithiol disulfide reductase [Cochleicola gelatinilyticus]OAB76098.1 hypothetical protein ULVI_13650 [Cochleicola gelatinilyticus]